MQRAKDFGKPVLVLLEADGFGFLQQQSSNNPNAYAAVADSGVAELAGCPTPWPAGGSPSCSCARRSAPATPSWASTSRGGPAARTSPTARVTDPLGARGRQGLQLPGAVRPGGQRHRRRPGTCWSAIRSTATRTSTRWSTGRTAGGTRATRASIELEELQPLRRVAAAVEREGEQALGAVADPARQLEPPQRRATTAARARATRTTAPSTSSATAPRTWRSSPTRA